MKYLSIIFVLVLGMLVFGQTKKPSKKVVNSTTPEFQTIPFNSDLQNLPPHFLGHNARSLLSNLFPFALEIIKGCGKYEKTEVCQTRLNSLYNLPISAKLTATDKLAFSVAVECDYFTDSETIRCSNSGFSRDYDWSHRLVDSKTYVGQNAFGVKKLVKYKKFENIFIKIDKDKPGFVLIKIPPEEARMVVPNLRLLVVGTLLQPFAKTDPVSYKPTLSEPEHIDGSNHSLIIEAEEIWLYNFESGKVLVKEKIGV